MTANQSIGEDAAVFFKNMSIGNLDGTYKNLIVSPTSLKQKVLALMDEEIQRGEQGRIVMKMNSVTDMDFIRKVAEASRAGVKVDLIVRGICCILPGNCTRDRESDCDQYCRPLSGTPESVCVRHGSRAESVHRFCGYDDQKHGETGGSGMSDSQRGDQKTAGEKPACNACR